MKKLGRWVSRLLPPVLHDPMRHAWFHARFGAPEWQYLKGGWTTTDARIKGWTDASIPRTQLTRWPGFVHATEGTRALGVSPEADATSEPDHFAHHMVMAYGYVLARTAHLRRRISVLDWGGGIGHYYVLGKVLCPEVEMDYWCKEVPPLCEAGRQVLPQSRFVDSEAELRGHSFDLVLASGSLQCSRDWYEVLGLLSSVARPYLYVTRLPIIREHPSFVAVQRVYAYGYDTEYMSWFLNRDDLVTTARSVGMELLREFAFERHPAVRSAPEQAEIGGFLFRYQHAIAPGLGEVVG